jgi:hypothetical protein
VLIRASPAVMGRRRRRMRSPDRWAKKAVNETVFRLKNC